MGRLDSVFAKNSPSLMPMKIHFSRMRRAVCHGAWVGLLKTSRNVWGSAFKTTSKTVLKAVCLPGLFAGEIAFAAQEIVIVKGIGGEPSFEESIHATALVWEQSARAAGHRVVLVAGGGKAEGEKAGAGSQFDRLRAVLESRGEANENAQGTPDVLWVVLIGHGSAQGKSPKFALEGPDLSAEALSGMLAKVRCPVIVVAGFSSGGAFVKPLSAPGRVIVAATRSGEEENWTRFSKCFAEAVTGTSADADADGQVSLFEAWRHAVAQVEAFYKDQGRMLTEHAVLEDTGDGRPVGVDAFKTAAKADEKKLRKNERVKEEGMKSRQWHLISDPVEAALTADQLVQREEIERKLRGLREDKSGRLPEDYQSEMEELLLRLAAIYADARERLAK
jgi:hypothetical protein